MNTDLLRAIGHLNMVLDEYAKNMWPTEQEDIRNALRVLQRLVRS